MSIQTISSCLLEKGKISSVNLKVLNCSQTAISLASMKTTLTSGLLILLMNVVFVFLFNFSVISNVFLSTLIWGAFLILGFPVLRIPFLTPKQQKYIVLCDLEGRQFILFFKLLNKDCFRFYKKGKYK